MNNLLLYQMQAVNNEVIYIICFAFFLFLFIILALAFLVNQYYKNQQKFFAEKDHYNQQILVTQAEVREEILHQVSREIHDNLGQITSLIGINLQITELEKDPAKEKLILKETAELVKKLSADMRELSLSLRSDSIAENGLVDSIDKEVERLNKSGHIAANYKHKGEEPELDKNTALFLYRIFQEMVNNTTKHAKASEMYIATFYHAPYFTFTYKDNGVGFNPNEIPNPSNRSSGLKNIKERCKLIGAEFILNSIPQLGTEITIEMEVKNEKN